MVSWFLFELSGDHLDLHVLTHSFPTRRSSDPEPQLGVGRVEHGHDGPALHARALGDATLEQRAGHLRGDLDLRCLHLARYADTVGRDRKSTRLNSSH